MIMKWDERENKKEQVEWENFYVNRGSVKDNKEGPKINIQLKKGGEKAIC